MPHHPTESTPMTVAPPSHRIRPIALGVVLPGLLMLAGFLRVWTWLPRIPDPAVLHWGTEGPDRTGPFTQLLLVLGVLFLVTWLPAAVFAVLSARHPVGRRLSVGVSAGMGALYAGIVVVTALPQVDAPAAEDVGAASWWLGGVCVGAFVLGILAALLAGDAPRGRATAAVPADAPRAPVEPDAAAPWVRTASVRAEPAWWAVGAAWTVGALALSYATSQWWLVVVLILPVVLVLGSVSWTVRIDREGLHARGLFGLPRLTVRASEILRADVTSIRPFAEFGGWGLRMRPDGTTALVTRRGEALRITTAGQQHTVVSLPDAAQAAALLNTMAQQTRL